MRRVERTIRGGGVHFTHASFHYNDYLRPEMLMYLGPAQNCSDTLGHSEMLNLEPTDTLQMLTK